MIPARLAVRKTVAYVNPEVAFDAVQSILRAELVAGGHSVLEATWRDVVSAEWPGLRERRRVTVQYIERGQKHGLPQAIHDESWRDLGPADQYEIATGEDGRS